RSLRTAGSCETTGPRTAAPRPPHPWGKAPTCGYDGALGGARNPQPLIRSQMLYPLSYERRWNLDSLRHGRSGRTRTAGGAGHETGRHVNPHPDHPAPRPAEVYTGAMSTKRL